LITTTLNKIKQYNPCQDGWEKLLNSLSKTKSDNEPLSILTIFESNGFKDAIWALRTLKGFDREIKLLICQFACKTLDIWEELYPKDFRPRMAIEAVALFAEGLIDVGEVNTASKAAYSAYAKADYAKDDYAAYANAAYNAANANAAYMAYIYIAYVAAETHVVVETREKELLLFLNQEHNYLKM